VPKATTDDVDRKGTATGRGDVAASRVSRRRDRRKAEIVRTATALLAEHGYQGLSLEDVAEQTDIGKATLYHYFSSKDELVGAALEALTQEVLTRLEARRQTVADRPPAEQLRALVDEQLLILTETAPEVATVFSWPKTWPKSFEEPMKDMRRRHDAVFRRVVDAGLASGELDCDNADVAMQCLHGILNQASVWMKPGQGADARADVVNAALRLFVAHPWFARART
jgi:Transcriptional regulator